MDTKEKVFFKWQGGRYEGIIEKEYENSVLIEVNNPDDELKDKYLSRIVVSKKEIKKK
ncbi:MULTISPECIES: DUF2187 domain-containing protein [Enterococcaceae]|uniref:DUF2187 domain-containing protein n=1 Tax=Enterococcaceae TaxID=81852 RepID=UPI000E536C85|nr:MULTISPECIES: DUF2187 domain-containing protein [Enterococcaceae]MCI0130251.1 DUF2187 domain-containing protein [Vagococcus sp. CY53-2]RGI31109.1 DUF2187 domain-containing protein [Melissococcus sp. OM08-11BH]UNM89072.1 DUF2187 domain-containing protein [Vagococcus sp. CY52-2]